MTTRLVEHIVISARRAASPAGIARFAGLAVPCRLGGAGVVRHKREGDGATPAGRFAVRHGFYRADRLTRPAGALALRALTPDDGWCDDPARREYNRFVRHPFAGSAERLWRDDGLYDLILVIGHNDDPPVKGAGSAVFVHVAPPGDRPTQGCIGLERPVLLRLLARLGPGAVVEIA